VAASLGFVPISPPAVRTIVNGTWRLVGSAGVYRARLYLAEVQRRRVAASTLRGLGVAIEEIARRLGAGVRSVHRWISEIRCVPSPCALSDFEARLRPTLKQALLNLSEGSVDSVFGLVGTQCQRPGEGFPSAQPMGGTGCPARSAEQANGVADAGRGVRGETSLAESPMAYIQRRIREITSVNAPRPP
jgi:hypothetical protein